MKIWNKLRLIGRIADQLLSLLDSYFTIGYSSILTWTIKCCAALKSYREECSYLPNG